MNSLPSLIQRVEQGEPEEGGVCHRCGEEHDAEDMFDAVICLWCAEEGWDD
jgi:hypothetical protein